MSQLYYSPATGGFYNSDIHQESQIPSGAIAITAAQWESFLSIIVSAQSKGQTIQFNATTGAPEAVAGSSATLTLAQVQDAATSQLLTNMNTFLATKPDGSVRYDQNFINDALIFALTNGASAEPLPSLLTWQKAVKSFYLAQKASIEASTTVSEVQAVDISLAGFESKYGVSGTVTADPNISTSALV